MEANEYETELRSVNPNTKLSNLEIETKNNESIMGDGNADCNRKIQDLEEKLSQQRERFKKQKERYEQDLEEKDDKIEELEDNVRDLEGKYNNLNIKYNKLKANFDEISRELDHHLEKVGFKSVVRKMKTVNQKDNPLEIIIKMKEKEIANTVQLMEVLRKNNEQLTKKLDTYCNVNFITDLQSKLNIKEKENQDLLVEIRTLNRGLDEHKRCIKSKKEGDEDNKTLKADLIKAKESNRDLQQKLKDEIARHMKTKDQLISLKREVDDSKRHKNISINDADAMKKFNSNIDLSSNNKKNKEKVYNLNHDTGVYDEEAVKYEEYVTMPTKENVKTSISTTNLKKVQKDEKAEIYEKRLDTLEKSKQSVENKYKTDIKQLNKKVQLQEDQIQYLTTQCRESEQKYKILQYQSNEYKSEKKVYQKKINDLQSQIDKLSNNMKEKDQENNILLGQLKDLKKVTKHNSVPPMYDITDIKKVSYYEDDSVVEQEQIINKEDSYEASEVH
jgi:chromosome segregation ATPase